MLKIITFLTGIPSVFSGVFIAYNQFLVMQAKIDANEKAIQSLIESSTNLQKSTKEITNVLVTQNGTLNEIKDTVSTISDNTPGIISSNTSTILYFIGIVFISVYQAMKLCKVYVKMGAWRRVLYCKNNKLMLLKTL